MTIPIRFPDSSEVIARDAAEFRSLPPRRRLAVIRGLVSAGSLMMRQSPKAAFLRVHADEQEEATRRAIREFVARHA